MNIHTRIRISAAGIGWHYLSNASCLIRPHVFSYGITCPMRLIEVAAVFTTFEEDVC